MQECRHISITDIIHEEVQTTESGEEAKLDCKRVIIKFFPELPRDWKEKYDKERKKCYFIVNRDNETSQV